MNLGQIRARCKVRYRDLSNIMVTDATWAGHINEGYREILASSPFWPFLEATSSALVVAANANSVDLPTDVWRILGAYNVTDKLPMLELAGRNAPYSAYPLQSDEKGVPEFYRLYGNDFQVFPWAAAATTFTVDYAVAPADLAADSDTPVFPAQYHQALSYYALAAALEDDEKRSDQYHMRFLGTLEKMRADLLGARGDTYPGIQDSFF